MDEQTTEQEQNELESQETPQEQTSDIAEGQSEFPGKKHMASQINKLRKALDERDAADEERETASKKIAEKERQKKLEEEGNYKAALADKEAAIAKLETEFTAKERRWKIRAGLAGMNDLALKGAIADCPDDADIDEYVAAVKKNNPDLFADSATRRSTVQGGRGASGDSGGNLKERVENNDPLAQAEVFNRVLSGKQAY